MLCYVLAVGMLSLSNKLLLEILFFPVYQLVFLFFSYFSHSNFPILLFFFACLPVDTLHTVSSPPNVLLMKAVPKYDKMLNLQINAYFFPVDYSNTW
jgi:hypothetical protein